MFRLLWTSYLALKTHPVLGTLFCEGESREYFTILSFACLSVLMRALSPHVNLSSVSVKLDILLTDSYN